MITHFISDLHLSEERPEIAEFFIQFLRIEARTSDALYILGDLFDAWIGDDDQSAFNQRIIQALRTVTSAGVPVYFMAGNRDFLIGERFAKQTGIKLLPDEHVINLYGTPTLLLHGDTLCTDDHRYQKFRRVIRNRWLLAIIKRLPLRLRRRLAGRLRSNSSTQATLTDEQLAYMDATESAIQDAFARHGVNRMIHGHTHLPDVHEHQLPSGEMVERIVLGDWYEHASILEFTADTYLLRHDEISDFYDDY